MTNGTYLNAQLHKTEKVQCDMQNPKVNKKKPPKPQPKPKVPLPNNNEYAWITYFSRLSGKSLHQWVQKCKTGKCSKVQNDALKIVTSKAYDPFAGNGNNSSVSISSFNKKKAYNNGYKGYNYNKGYQIGAKLSKTPTRSMLTNKEPSNELAKHKFYGKQNAQFNAMRNGYLQL